MYYSILSRKPLFNCLTLNLINDFFANALISDYKKLITLTIEKWNNQTMSHNYVSQSFSVIIQKIVYLRRFPFHAIITDSSGDKCRKNHHNYFICL